MTGKEIKQWLAQNGMSREELAEKLGIKPASVLGWTASNRPVPVKHQQTIRSLMGLLPLETAIQETPYNAVHVITVRFSGEEYARVLEKFGAAGGKSLEPIVREILLAENAGNHSCPNGNAIK